MEFEDFNFKILCCPLRQFWSKNPRMFFPKNPASSLFKFDYALP